MYLYKFTGGESVILQVRFTMNFRGRKNLKWTFWWIRGLRNLFYDNQCPYWSRGFSQICFRKQWRWWHTWYTRYMAIGNSTDTYQSVIITPHMKIYLTLYLFYIWKTIYWHIFRFIFLLMGEGSSVSRQFDLLVWYCDVGCQIYRRYLHFLGFYIMADDNCHMTITWSTYYNIILWSLKWI